MIRPTGSDRSVAFTSDTPPRDEVCSRLALGPQPPSIEHGNDHRTDDHVAVDPPPTVETIAAKAKPSNGPSIKAVHGIGAIFGSIAVHGTAAAAMYFMFVPVHSMWFLTQRQGRDSIELAASMATPPPKSDETVTIAPPETTPPKQKSPEPEPLDAEPMAAVAKQELAAAERPSAAFVDIKEAPGLHATISEIRADVESPDTSEALPTEQLKRKSRPTEHALPRDSAVFITPESVASAASAADSGVVIDQPPTIVHSIPPVYPPESKAARETGIVKLRVKIGALGQVEAASVYRTSGFARLDQAALEAIHSYRFSPAGSSGGQAAEFVWPITFRLKEVPARR
jgi:TonB family protein